MGLPFKIKKALFPRTRVINRTINQSSDGGESAWGSISGSITDQTDLVEYVEDEIADAGLGISLGETSDTAYRGDRGKTAYDHSQATHAPSNAQKNSDITKAEIEAKLTGEISTHTHAYSTLALGETDSTAYRGDRGKTAYDHSQLTTGNPHSVSKTDVGLSNVTNDAQVAITGTQTVTGKKTFDVAGNYSDIFIGETISIAGIDAQTCFALNAYLDNGTWKHLTTGHALLIVTDVSTGDLVTYYSASDDAGNTASFVERQRLSANGVVKFQRAVRTVHQTLTSSSSNIAIDFALGLNFKHTFTENTTLGNPTNLEEGQSGFIFLTQHASSPKTLAYDSYWHFRGDDDVSAVNGAFDTIVYTVRSSTYIEAVLRKGV